MTYMEPPRYKDGNEIRTGDRVTWAGHPASVVAVIDTQSYSPMFPETEWSHLGAGFMLDVEGVGLVYEEEAHEDLQLIGRTNR